MRGLLDVTDNLAGDGVRPPDDVVRRDGDDPYLVVAADKGTATFSDIANGVSREYGFWLDDAFASGGSAGYDHKKMGITARGAWEAVQAPLPRARRRHPERGLHRASASATCRATCSATACCSRAHPGCSPPSTTATSSSIPIPIRRQSFAERERLFDLPRSSWADYDAKLISHGGGVFDAQAEVDHALAGDARACFGIDAERADAGRADPRDPAGAGRPALLRRHRHLRARPRDETHAEVGDRANDALRVDGSELRARVVGEGANLGVTQRGRIEYARRRRRQGGSINTDAIDNSAGVDTSDHEVNIKILLGDVVARGDLTLKQRDALLASMTDDVADLVLRDNYLQTQAISVAEARGVGGCRRAGALHAQRWRRPAGSTARSSSCPTTRRSRAGTPRASA